MINCLLHSIIFTNESLICHVKLKHIQEPSATLIDIFYVFMYRYTFDPVCIILILCTVLEKIHTEFKFVHHLLFKSH